MTGLVQADGQPYQGETVAVMDESAREAGAGVYYVVCTVVILDPVSASRTAQGLVGERGRPFHYRDEGPEAIERMLSLFEESEVLATSLWRSVGRTGQVIARQDLLREHALRCANDGIDHLIIESGDHTTNQRDQNVLLDTFQEIGGVPYKYDWRSKSEPLIWIADAVSGITSKSLVDGEDAYFERLASSGRLEVINF